MGGGVTPCINFHFMFQTIEQHTAAAGPSRGRSKTPLWDLSETPPSPVLGGLGSLGGVPRQPLHPIFHPGGALSPCLDNVPPSCASSGTSMAANETETIGERAREGEKCFPGC